MAPKRPKSTANQVDWKGGGREKKSEDAPPDESAEGPGAADDIFPMVLTSATQELFKCRADEDVTGENPYKILSRDDIVRDMRTRAAVSDFSPVKQAVLGYPEDELLLVFDRDFTCGQSFYLVLTVEAKERILNPPVPAEEEVSEEEGPDGFVLKTPEPQPWVSLGSELEMEEECVRESRARLRYRISRVRRELGAPTCFSDRNAGESKEGFTECPPHQDQSDSIRELQRHCGTQVVPCRRTCGTQTLWKYPKNVCTQYEAREFTEEEKENCLQSENLRNFISSVVARFEMVLQQNEIMDAFIDDWRALSQEDGGLGGKTDPHLREYQSFTDLRFSREKSISHISWHPTAPGVIVVAVTERLSFEERINDSTKLLLNPSLILFWSFSDPINPQLVLECPDDVCAFEFCPSDPNVIAGGCMNGQVVLWDISAHAERLQASRTGAAQRTSTNPGVFVERRAGGGAAVRYCAVSGIERGHRAPITDLQWLPASFEVSRTGIPLENVNQMCVQMVTCAPDCCVMFWDVRVLRGGAPSVSDRRQRGEERTLDHPHGVPHTFKHLDLTWKPHMQVSLPKIDSPGEYSPLRLSLRDNTVDSPADRSHQATERSEVLGYSQLRVPSVQHSKPVEDISTRFFLGTEDGELVYTDWKLEKDNDSGRLFSTKPISCFSVHHGLVNTVCRSPFFKDIILTVGGWTFAIWKEGVTMGPIVSSSSQTRSTQGCWSPSRPGVFFIGKEDGSVEVWDLLEKTHEPSQTQNITTVHITCIRPGGVSPKQHLLAVSDHHGTLHVLEIPWTLRQPSSSEKLTVWRYFEREVDRLIYFQKRQEMRAKEKKEREAEEQRKKMATVEEKPGEQIDEEALKEYEDYLALEKVILKDMGVLPDTVGRAPV